jgi:hypothetical protein
MRTTQSKPKNQIKTNTLNSKGIKILAITGGNTPGKDITMASSSVKYSSACKPTKDHLGIKYPSIKAMAEHYKIIPSELGRYLRDNSPTKQSLIMILKPNKKQKPKQNKAPKITTTNPAKNGKINVTRFKNVPALINEPAYLYIAETPENNNIWLKAGITYRQFPTIGKKLTQHVINTKIIYKWPTTLVKAYFAEQLILKFLSNKKIKLPTKAPFTEVFDEALDKHKLEKIIKGINQIFRDINKQVNNKQISGSNIERIFNSLLK